MRKWFSKYFCSRNKFAELMSHGYDRKLSCKEKLCFLVHYIMCFTCRRVKVQIDLLQLELPKLDQCQSISNKKLSEDARSRIKSKLNF